jgi:methyl-accepting chemotaxis protein
VHIIPKEKFRKAVDHLVQIAATLATAAYQKLKEKRAKEEIKKREEEQARAITAFSKVLGKVATGDLSARVDTKGWSEELEVIGMAMNTLIESLEFEKHRKS